MNDFTQYIVTFWRAECIFTFVIVAVAAVNYIRHVLLHVLLSRKLYHDYSVIILIEGACLIEGAEREESDAIFPDQNVQRHSMTSNGTARSLANGPSGGGLGMNSPGISPSRISLLSMGGVCGRSLTAGKFSSLEGKHAPSIQYYDSVIMTAISTSGFKVNFLYYYYNFLL